MPGTLPSPYPVGTRRLILYESEGAGGLLVFGPPVPPASLTAAPPLIVELDARHVRFLLVLTRHWREPTGDPVEDALSSYVTAGQVARELNGAGALGYLVEEGTVKAYAAAVSQRIRSGTPAGYAPPKVHESARLRGYRLVAPLEVVAGGKVGGNGAG